MIASISKINQGSPTTVERCNLNCYILDKSFTISITRLLGSTKILTITLGTMSRHLYGIIFCYLWMTSFTLLRIKKSLIRILFFGGNFIYLWLYYWLCRGWTFYTTSFNCSSFYILFYLSYLSSMPCLLCFIAFIKNHRTIWLSASSRSFISRKKIIAVIYHAHPLTSWTWYGLVWDKRIQINLIWFY